MPKHRDEGPEEPSPGSSENSQNSLFSHSRRNIVKGWPAPLSALAMYGLAGDIVSTISPHTEADPAALLVQSLVAFGNVAGPVPVFMVEADRHSGVLFCALVGDSAKARKGTSWGHIRRLMGTVDAAWARERQLSGLVSGEGLIWAVRDQKDGNEASGDKRLLVIEPELASVLRAMARRENTLSATIREAWDHGNLRTMAKKSPAVATGAHISIIAHITTDEVRRELQHTDRANGFANRFLWVCAKRSKCLPEGGTLQPQELVALSKRLQSAIQFARGVTELKRDEGCRRLWRETYPALSEGRVGMVGAIVSRAEAQVVRLSSVFALLEESAIIREEHLRAALEVWRYCEDSATYVFGKSSGDPQADKVRDALESIAPKGFTRTEISGLLGHHASAERIGEILDSLGRQGIVRKQVETGDGRLTEHWFFSANAK